MTLIPKKQNQIFGSIVLFLLWACAGSIAWANDKVITIATSEGAPHIIDGVQKGIDLDITEFVVKQMGYKVDFVFMSLARAVKEVKAGRVDAVTPTFSQQDEERFFVSEPFIEYKPMVFSLSTRQKSPVSLSDLAGESIATFQGAPGYFGPEFVKLSRMEGYHEIHDMRLIPEMLVRERVSYAVLDQYIFYFYYRLNDKQRPISVFDQHQLIPPVKAGIAFHNKDLRDLFDKQLTTSLNSHIQSAIVERYLGELTP